MEAEAESPVANPVGKVKPFEGWPDVQVVYHRDIHTGLFTQYPDVKVDGTMLVTKGPVVVSGEKGQLLTVNLTMYVSRVAVEDK